MGTTDPATDCVVSVSYSWTTHWTFLTGEPGERPTEEVDREREKKQ